MRGGRRRPDRNTRGRGTRRSPPDDGAALWRAVCEHELEGIAVKRRSGRFLPGERGWVKVKNRDYWRCELERTSAIRPRRVVGRLDHEHAMEPAAEHVVHSRVDRQDADASALSERERLADGPVRNHADERWRVMRLAIRP